MIIMKDALKHKTKFKLWKFKGDYKSLKEALSKTKPYEVIEGEDNVFLNEGINEIWKLVIGSSSNHFDSSHAQIGVGDSNTSASASQTGLQGSNTYYKGMDSGYPSISGTKVTFQATFGSTEANFHWQEWCVHHSSSGIDINRKVQDMGVKSSGSTWTLQVTLELT